MTKAAALFASAGRLLGEFSAFAGRRLFSASALVAAAALLDGVSLLLLVPLVGIVAGPGGAGRLQSAAAALFSHFGLVGPTARLCALLAIFSGLIVLRAAVMRARDVALGTLQSGFVARRRMAVIEALAAAPWPAVAGLRHARIAHATGGDIQRIATAVNYLLQIATALAMLAAQAVLALVLSPPLALLAFVLLALMGAVLLPMLHRARALGEHVTRANVDLLHATAQFLGGLKLAMSQDMQRPFVAAFRAELDEVTRRQIDNARRNSTGRVALTTLSGLLGVFLVLVGFVVLHLPAPILIASLAVIARMAGPVGQIQQAAQQLAFALPAFEELSLLEAELRAAAPLPVGSEIVPFPEGDIVFENVRYAHAGEDGRGLSGLNLVIGAGECLGIAGPSGAGKTTFADLLAGLIAPQAGRIRIGTQPLDGATRAALRSALAYVAQDPFLLHETIRRNLSRASPQADEAAMWRALDDAGAGELVRRIGLDAVVGERGMLLSGGERQRIALARALLRAPRLLILDEATSAVDGESERAIFARLRRRSPRPTLVLIAHRQESLALCDRVVFFVHGRVAEKPAGLSPVSLI